MITTKREMFRLSRQGALGNFSRLYTADEVAVLPPGTIVGLRAMVPRSPLFKVSDSPQKTLAALNTLRASGVGQSLILCEAPDPKRVTIQGEIWNGRGPLVFEHTYVQLPMRFALEQERLHTVGLQARMLLRQHMDPVAFDWLMDLLDRYPDCVVEVSMFNGPVGHLGWNTMFWEVRNY